MNMGRSWTPPDNAKILPDLYNVLDARALKRTSSLNGVLDAHLTTQQNVLARHRYLAERIHKEEKARVSKALTHIHDKLPAVQRIRDFNLKFFNNKSLEDFSTAAKKSKGNNTYNKSDELICRRCYNHHFAIQKNQLTNGFALPSIPKNRRLPAVFGTTGNGNNQASTQQQQQNASENETENPRSNTDPNHVTTDNGDDSIHPESETTPNFLSSSDNKAAGDAHSKSRDLDKPGSPTKQAFGWWMPRNKSFQFLQKDSAGREMDVNKHYTPRLMPYEDWKNVVRDVCAHCARPEDCVASRQPRGSINVTAIHWR